MADAHFEEERIARMTGITWEQAREKVRERYGDAHSLQDAIGWLIAHNERVAYGSELVRDWLTFEHAASEGEAWLNLYARMTETTVVPPEGLPSPPKRQCIATLDDTRDCCAPDCPCSRPAIPNFEADMQRAIDHGNVSARMEALQAQLDAAQQALSTAVDDWDKDLTSAEEQIARLTGAVPCEMPPLPTRPSPSAFGSNGYGEWINISNQQLRTYADGMEAALQTATEALAAERETLRSRSAELTTAIDGQIKTEADNTLLRDALKGYQQAAESWHRFHHGSSSVQCDAICELIPVGRAALAAVEGKGGL